MVGYIVMITVWWGNNHNNDNLYGGVYYNDNSISGGYHNDNSLSREETPQ